MAKANTYTPSHLVIQDFQIKVEEDSEDELDEETLDYESTLIDTITIQDEELKLIDAVIKQASENVIPIQKVVQYCERLTNNVNSKDKTYPYALGGQNAVLLPHYENEVKFSNIRWIPVPEENEKLAATTNASLWVSEDQNPVREFICEVKTEEDLHDAVLQLKMNWINMINTKLNTCNVIPDSKFIILEIAYLKDPITGRKGLTGMTFIQCTQDDKSVRVEDICNVKISTNHRNTARGDMYDFLINKNPELRIFVYAPEFSYIINMYRSTLFPWSGLFHLIHHRFINIITMLKLNSLTDSTQLKSLCIDSNIHSNSCSHCNAINLLYKICNGEYTLRDREFFRGVFKTKAGHVPVKIMEKPCLYKTVRCTYVVHITYGDEVDGKNYEYCTCHTTYQPSNKRVQDNSEVIEPAYKRIKN